MHEGLERRLTRWSAWLSASTPKDLESLVRGLLIQYFFHVSQREIIEIVGLPPGVPPRLNLLAPASFRGRGRIRVAHDAILGWRQSPFSYSASYLEARHADAVIDVGARTTINNAAVLIAEGAGIRIGARCLIGTELQVFDTNAHELEIGRRHMADSRTRSVTIGDDVFIGSRVTLLKGVTLGAGCVVAAGTVVPPGFEAPPGSIVAGNPARIVGEVPSAAH